MKILLIGLAGAGKSRLAAHLGARLGLAVHALDEHRRALSDGSVAGDYLARAAFLRACAGRASALLEFGGCGAHRHAVHLALEESGARVHTIWIDTPDPVRAQHLARRTGGPPLPRWALPLGAADADLRTVLQRDAEAGLWLNLPGWTFQVLAGDVDVEVQVEAVLAALGGVPAATTQDPATFAPQPADSVLFVTLDSCRYDTARDARTPHLRRVGEPHRAMAPSHFTLASHAAFWVGTTPGLAHSERPGLNPKRGRLFRLANALVPAGPRDLFALEGASLMEGFARRGYRTLGTGAVDWFDTGTPTGRALVSDFQRFHYVRGPGALEEQVAWLAGELDQAAGTPVFCFLNVGETHVPYWHQGAPWFREDNPCRPFAGDANDAAACRRRQRACLEHADAVLGPLLAAFQGATVLVCGDHGDCWGEDGLWEHGVWHEKTMEVPLWVAVRGEILGEGGAPC
jgi:predicted kinase